MSTRIPVYRPTLTEQEVQAVLRIILENPAQSTPELLSVRKKFTLINLKATAGIDTSVGTVSPRISLLESLGENAARETELASRDYLYATGTDIEKAAIEACIMQEMTDGKEHSWKEFLVASPPQQTTNTQE